MSGSIVSNARSPISRPWCSICARGCSYGAYFSTQSSTLPAAQATGKVGGEVNKGTIELEQEDGQWKVANQSWTNTK